MHVVLVKCFNTLSSQCCATFKCVHTDPRKADSRQKLHRAASWPSAAVSSWQLANGSTFASDNPGIVPACLSLSLSPCLLSRPLSSLPPSFHFSRLTQVLSPSPSLPVSSLPLRPVAFLFRTVEWTCFPRVSSSRSQHGWVAEGTGTRWVVEAQGELLSNRLLPNANTLVTPTHSHIHTHQHATIPWGSSMSLTRMRTYAH